MSAPAKKEDLPEIRKEGSPPGPAQWCANCVHFRPGPIVVQGNTLGACHASGLSLIPREVTANDFCQQHRLRVGVLT